MANIKINGNDKELIDLSQSRMTENTQDRKPPESEFKIKTELLESSETSKIKIIKNLE